MASPFLDLFNSAEQQFRFLRRRWPRRVEAFDDVARLSVYKRRGVANDSTRLNYTGNRGKRQEIHGQAPQFSGIVGQRPRPVSLREKKSEPLLLHSGIMDVKRQSPNVWHDNRVSKTDAPQTSYFAPAFSRAVNDPRQSVRAGGKNSFSIQKREKAVFQSNRSLQYKAFD